MAGMTASVGARAWRCGGEIWLLAVNATRSPQKATLKLDASMTGAVTPVFGTPPLCKAGNVFEYSFAPMECVFVRGREAK